MLIIKWLNGEHGWTDFNTADITYMSRNHAIDLFSRGIPVIIKDGDEYITNKVDLFHRYKKERKPIRMLSECVISDKLICDVGFIGDCCNTK